MSEDDRPITVNELRPFFAGDLDERVLALALARFHLAQAQQTVAVRDARIAELVTPDEG
jgi:hypothetical protein